MVAQSVLWLMLPAVVYGAMASLLFEPEPPRWQVRARSRLVAAGAAVGRAVRALGRAVAGRAGRSRRSTPVENPFEALTVQIRLGQLAQELRVLDADQHVWAKGRRVMATQAAYDDLLAEACRLAGVDVPAGTRRDGAPQAEPERFREEIELASRGWSW